MLKIIISTNIRHVNSDQVSGNLYVVDVDKNVILKKTTGIEVPGRKFDTNSRGGMRGIRGIGYYNGELAIATYSAVHVFNKSWNLLRSITHPSIASIHEIYLCESGLWVTSTANDILANFSINGELLRFFYLRKIPGLKKIFGRSKIILTDSEILDGKLDFRTRSYNISDKYDSVHLNSIDIQPDNTLLLSLGLIVNKQFHFQLAIKAFFMKTFFWRLFLNLNRFVLRKLSLQKKMLSDLVIQPAKVTSQIVRLTPECKWIEISEFQIGQNPSHSARNYIDNSFLYLETSTGNLLHCTSEGVVISKTKISDKFLRGLFVLPDGRLLIGASNVLLLFDLNSKEIISETKISDNEYEYIFEVHEFPTNFELPPESLQEKLGKIVKYQGREVMWEL